jgi:hypothetical protein
VNAGPQGGYPPEPWDLRGRMYLSVFSVPRAALPELPATVAAAVRPPGARALVGAAWVDYRPGGVLSYRELLAAVLVREGGRARFSITDIWVDSVASRDGGRALWGIPKDLARLTLRPGTAGGTLAAASVGAEPGSEPAPIGVAAFRAGRRLPGRWPIRMTVLQAYGDGVRRTHVRGHTGLRLGRATWRVDARGPLGYLAGRRPLVTLTLTDFSMRFGEVRR